MHFHRIGGRCYMTVILYTACLTACAFPPAQGKSSLEYSKRRTSRSGTTLPDTVTLQTLRNASSMMCTNAMVMPYARMVLLSDEHMLGVLQDMGGNYIKDYMASTEEEALQNFPNMLVLTAPQSINGSITSFSTMDNFATKQVIMDDLHKLTIYLMSNKNHSNSVDNTLGSVHLHTGTNPTSTPLPNNQLHTNQTENNSSVFTQTFQNATHTKALPHRVTYSLAVSVDTPTINNATGKYTAAVPQGTTKIVSSTDSHSGNRTMEVEKLTSNKPDVRTKSTEDSTSTTVSNSNTVLTEYRRATTQNAETSSTAKSPSTVEAYTSVADPTTPSHTMSTTNPTIPTHTMSTAASITGPVSPPTTVARTTDAYLSTLDEKIISVTSTMEATSTTVDPDVLKGIEQLHQYVKGSGFLLDSGLTKRELDLIWRDVNTTLHPSLLLGLVPGSRRKKRNTHGSGSVEEYCQPKGALTEDRKFIHLCSMCATTTKLADDIFPRYINEAVCKTGDTDCFTVGRTVHGQCKQTQFSLNMLRKKTGHCNMLLHGGETLVFEDYELVPQRIRVSCECTINKLSTERCQSLAEFGKFSTDFYPGNVGGLIHHNRMTVHDNTPAWALYKLDDKHSNTQKQKPKF